jgi:hypothetical protein
MLHSADRTCTSDLHFLHSCWHRVSAVTALAYSRPTPPALQAKEAERLAEDRAQAVQRLTLDLNAVKVDAQVRQSDKHRPQWEVT